METKHTHTHPYTVCRFYISDRRLWQHSSVYIVIVAQTFNPVASGYWMGFQETESSTLIVRFDPFSLKVVLSSYLPMTATFHVGKIGTRNGGKAVTYKAAVEPQEVRLDSAWRWSVRRIQGGEIICLERGQDS